MLGGCNQHIHDLEAKHLKMDDHEFLSQMIAHDDQYYDKARAERQTVWLEKK